MTLLFLHLTSTYPIYEQLTYSLNKEQLNAMLIRDTQLLFDWRRL